MCKQCGTDDCAGECSINKLITAEIGIWKEFTSKNGISMIEGITMNWEKQYKYRDNTGPWSFYVTVGGMSDMKGFMWKVNEDKVLSLFGLHYSSTDCVAFKCNNLAEAEFFILRYLEANNLELAPLYQKL